MSICVIRGQALLAKDAPQGGGFLKEKDRPGKGLVTEPVVSHSETGIALAIEGWRIWLNTKVIPAIGTPSSLTAFTEP